MNPGAKIIELRQLLAGRFPAPELKAGACLSTGIARIDELLGGGLRRGTITELVGPAPSCGGAVAIVSILRVAASANQWMALIDGRDCFDPQSVENETLAHLLWVRCKNAAQAIQAADLLLRDGNLPLAILDLRGNPPAELRKIPATTWYRLQRIVEQSSVALLAVTPRAMAASAQSRLALQSRFTLDAIEGEQEKLLDELSADFADGRGFQQSGAPHLRQSA